MAYRIILLFVSLAVLLQDFHVSAGCNENCADKPVFTPSRLVVKYGDPASANCSVCQHDCHNSLFDLEKAVGNSTKNHTDILWSVDRLTEWGLSLQCYYTNATNYQCCSILPLTVYKPPDNVTISFVNPGPMHEGHNYSLQCTVQRVAPVESLIVVFYRGQTVLGKVQSKRNTVNDSVTETLTFDMIPTWQDNGAEYWCEAKLQLGPEGPQPPPVWTSPNITATVYYKPRTNASSPYEVIVKEGDPLHLNFTTVGNPDPKYTWEFPLYNGSKPGENVLTLESVTSLDQGRYTFRAYNELGSVTMQFDVHVQGLEPTTTTGPTPRPATKEITTMSLDVRDQSTSSKPIHWFILCFIFLFFSALV